MTPEGQAALKALAVRFKTTPEKVEQEIRATMRDMWPGLPIASKPKRLRKAR